MISTPLRTPARASADGLAGLGGGAVCQAVEVGEHQLAERNRVWVRSLIGIARHAGAAARAAATARATSAAPDSGTRPMTSPV